MPRRRLLAGIGGILIAPLYNVAYDMGTLFGIKAFAVAILGGLTNPWGVVIAGLPMVWWKPAPRPGSAPAAPRSSHSLP